MHCNGGGVLRREERSTRPGGFEGRAWVGKIPDRPADRPGEVIGSSTSTTSRYPFLTLYDEKNLCKPRSDSLYLKSGKRYRLVVAEWCRAIK